MDPQICLSHIIGMLSDTDRSDYENEAEFREELVDSLNDLMTWIKAGGWIPRFPE